MQFIFVCMSVIASASLCLRFVCTIKVKKKLPLETKNTQNHENRRLGLIESLHMPCLLSLGSSVNYLNTSVSFCFVAEIYPRYFYLYFFARHENIPI